MNLGSPPEWVSAFANLGVFVIALTLLRGAHVRARKAELSLATADGERRRSITNHFLKILDYAGDATAEALSAFSIEQADHIYYKHYALFQAALWRQSAVSNDYSRYRIYRWTFTVSAIDLARSLSRLD